MHGRGAVVICRIPDETLVRYWARDLSDAEMDEVDEHVFGCTDCFAASSRVAAVADGLATALPPVVLRRDVARAERRGLRTVTNDLHVNSPKETRLPADAEMLVHRLVANLGDVEKVALDITMLDDTVLVSFDDVAFDRAEGAVIVACHRHFAEQFPPDAKLVLRCQDVRGRETVQKYTVLHRFD
jgi:hypothetical protein